MADRAYFYMDNLTEKGTFTVTSEATGFPKENVQDRDQASLWKPGDATNPQVWILDCGSAMTARASVIVSSNLYSKSVGTKISIDNGDNPAFPNPIYLVGSAGVYHAPTAADDPVWLERFGIDRSKRYWRWEFDTGGDTDVEIGDIYLFPEIDTGRHPGGPWTLGFDDDTRLHRGAVMQGASTRAPATEFGLQFTKIAKSVWDDIDAGYQIVRAGFLPFVYVDEYGLVRLVRFTKAPREGHHFGTLVDFTLQMVEDY